MRCDTYPQNLCDVAMTGFDALAAHYRRFIERSVVTARLRVSPVNAPNRGPPH
jgi:hypothetical protein